MKVKSIHVASLIVGLAAGLAGAAVGFFGDADVWVVIAAGVGCFLLLFGVAQVVVHKFVLHKIKPLAQIVLARDLGEDELEVQFPDKQSMVDDMGEQLSDWADSKSREITRLRENEKYRREFLGNISHELKTPIFTIQGYILTLLDGAVDDPAINRKYLARAEKGIDRMIDIVTDLEEISKLESGELVLNKERLDVAGLAHEIAEDAAMEADKQGISIFIGDDPYTEAPVPVWITADRKYIEQVLWNLVMNSIKYGREGGRTRISFTDMFDKVMVEVSDDGIGIAPEEINRVFERFYRTDKSRSREMGGTGLGLSIVKHILQAHNESITLRSQPDKGSTFSFTLAK